MFTDKSAWYLLKKISYGHKFAKRSNMIGNMSMHLTFKLAHMSEEIFYLKKTEGRKVRPTLLMLTLKRVFFDFEVSLIHTMLWQESMVFI